MATKSELEVANWFDQLIHDKKNFTARYLAKVNEVTSIEIDIIVKAFCGVVILALMFSNEAQTICNFFLAIVPILLIYVHPDEKPPANILFLHFSIFGFSTIFDRLLGLIPFYFVLKLALFLALYLPPSNRLIDKFEAMLVPPRK
ncbi:unnamed protein product [Caenorhabditis bovis]|uniref:Receptor expression-enhancing protein n=1 Tax=Caenorhabditis bovis TaxID=2654633 RepID=A0A8S1F751_9PELO|nr:unnamed protein product [Caenorhabditis bovis]